MASKTPKSDVREGSVSALTDITSSRQEESTGARHIYEDALSADLDDVRSLQALHSALNEALQATTVTYQYGPQTVLLGVSQHSRSCQAHSS